MPDFTLLLQGRKPFSGSLSVETPPPVWPDPLDDVVGPKTFIGTDFARTRGWTSPHPKWQQTNMVMPMFYLVDGEPVFAKDIIRLDRRPYWLDEFWRLWLGPVLWPLYCQPGSGYQDTNSKPTDPDNGVYKQGTIDDGCNLHRLIGVPFSTRLGMFQQVEAVDYFDHPAPDELNYFATPHLVHKNVVASISQVEPVAYITHQKNGDGVWPNLMNHDQPLILPDALLERFPALPFETEYLGVPATITGYCFQASTVYGLFPDGWRMIEKVDISGIGSAYYDRRVYLTGWIGTPPPTIKGFTRGKDTLFDWQIQQPQIPAQYNVAYIQAIQEWLKKV